MTEYTSATSIIRDIEAMLREGKGEIWKIEVEGFGMHDKVTVGFNVNKPIPNPMQQLSNPYEEGMKSFTKFMEDQMKKMSNYNGN